MLFHISKDISVKEKVFIPRIPKNRLQSENKTLKRVCLSDALETCISAFPYKSEVIHYLSSKKPTYLSVYTVDKALFHEETIKKPEEVVNWVADAEIRQEYWITKPFTATPKLIKLKKLKLERFCRLTGEHIGEVEELEFEREVEEYDRTEKALFYHRKIFKQFRRACKRNGIEIQEVHVKKEAMEYFGCISSTRIYDVTRVTYKIPAGISAQSAWECITRELHKNRRKHLCYSHEDFHVKEEQENTIVREAVVA